MKRFWKEVAVAETDGGFRIELDGRSVRTQGGAAQRVPTRALAEAMAEEWRSQDDEIDPKTFPLRDLADFAIDHARTERGRVVDKLLAYAETDTLCYRASPDEPLFRRQQDLWEPLLAGFETRHAVRLTRVSGVIHRAHPPETLSRLRALLESQDDFSLAALNALAPLAASLTVALSALEPEADVPALFGAANCEQDWQAELWGWDAEAERNRAERLAGFEIAARFARLARAS